MKPLRARVLGLTMIALSITGCPKYFKAVQAAGEAGEKVSDETAVLESTTQTCLEIAALSGHITDHFPDFFSLTIELGHGLSV